MYIILWGALPWLIFLGIWLVFWTWLLWPWQHGRGKGLGKEAGRIDALQGLNGLSTHVWEQVKKLPGMPPFEVVFDINTFQYHARWIDIGGATNSVSANDPNELLTKLQAYAQNNIENIAKIVPLPDGFKTTSAQEEFSELFMENYGKLEAWIEYLEDYAGTYGPGMDESKRPDCLPDIVNLLDK